MAWHEAKCPACASEIYVPDEDEKLFCPKCSQEIYVQAALAFKESSTAPKQHSSGWRSATAASQSTSINKAMSNKPGTATSLSNSENNRLAAAQSFSFLDNWKTSVGIFILGLICSNACSLVSYFGTVPSIIMAIVFALGTLGWALGGYPSLFTDKPCLKSRNAACFLNAFFGGIVFGALWCTCLTKKKRGVSQYVQSALIFATAIGICAMMIFGPQIGMNSFNSEQLYDSPSLLMRTDEAKIVVNAGSFSTNEERAESPLGIITFGELSQNGKSWSAQDIPTREAALELKSLALAQLYGGSDKAQAAHQESVNLPSEQEQLKSAYMLGGSDGTIAISRDKYKSDDGLTVTCIVSYYVSNWYGKNQEPEYFDVYIDISR